MERELSSDNHFTEQQRGRRGAIDRLGLVADVRHQCHKPCSLGCPSEVALTSCRELGAAAIHHTSVRIHVRVEASDVLEVDVLNVVR